MNPTVRSLVLSAVDWDELCPWLKIRKCLQLAFSKRLLLIATVHLLTVSIWLAVAFGWFTVLEDFLKAGSPISAYVPHAVSVLENPTVTNAFSEDVAVFTSDADASLSRFMEDIAENSVLNQEQNLNQEQGQARNQNQGQEETKESVSKISVGAFVNRTFATLYAILSTLALWLTIARLTALKITREYRSSIRAEMKFAVKKIPSVLGALLIIVLGLTLLALPLLLGRLILSYDWFCLASVWAGMTPALLVYSTFLFLILAGCALGIFFIPSVLATENSDAFDAISRSYAYSLQKLLRLPFYLLAVVLFGIPGFLLMVFCVVSILTLYLWGTGAAIFQSPLIQLCLYGFSWTVSAFLFVYFIASFEAVYLLLRRDVDAVELDVVWLPEPQGVPTPKLPNLE